MKKEIIKIITENTKFWQPNGKKGSCFIIEEKEPFWWQINKRWAEEVADKIIEAIKKTTPPK